MKLCLAKSENERTGRNAVDREKDRTFAPADVSETERKESYKEAVTNAEPTPPAAPEAGAPPKLLRVFHAADFHLDSPFAGMDLKSSDARRRTLLSVFLSALHRAVEDGCQLILLSGDLFDSGYVTTDTLEAVKAGLKACPLPVVIAPGNHDPFVPGGVFSGDWPDNVTVFSSETLTYADFDALGVRVHGYAFTSDSYTAHPLSGGVALHPTYWNLLCAHADLASPLSRYAPIAPAELAASGFDYAALGHIHKSPAPQTLGKSLVAYAGFPMGRGFDELGNGSALEIALDRSKGSVALTRLVLSTQRYVIEALDITGAARSGDAAEKLQRLISEKGYGTETCLRVVLTGAVTPGFPAELSLGRETFGTALLEIRNDTVPLYDADALESDPTLKGAFYRELCEQLRSPDEYSRRVAAEALRIGLLALDGRSFT